MGKLKNSLLKTMFRAACAFVGCFPLELHSEFYYPVANVLRRALHLDYSAIYEELRDKFTTSGAPLMQGVSLHEQEQNRERREQWEQKYDKWCLLSGERLKEIYRLMDEQKQKLANRKNEGLPGYKFKMFLLKDRSINDDGLFLHGRHPFGINVFARSIQAYYEATGELNIDEKIRENLTTCMYVISSEHFLRKILGDAVVNKFADGFDSVMEDVKANRERLQRGIDIHHDIFLKSESKGSLAPTVIVRSYFRDFSPINAQQPIFHHDLILQFTINIEYNILKKIELFKYDNKDVHVRYVYGKCLYKREIWF